MPTYLKTTCHACGGENISINPKGVLVNHQERIVTRSGEVVEGRLRCLGSGEEPEPVEVS